MDKVAWGAAVLLFALLLLQPGLPTAGAHQGDHAPGEGHDEAPPPDRDFLNPDAQPITPNASYVRQENPAVHTSLIVWEETEYGRSTNIVAYNASTDAGAFPLSTRAIQETNPTVRGPWIAWEQHHQGDNATTDIAVLDIRTGTTFTVPDDGHDQHDPVIGGNATVYYAEDHDDVTYLRAYDLENRNVWAPAGDTPIIWEPSAHGSTVAWAEGSRTRAKIVMHDTATDTTEKVPDRWNLREGPRVGPHGVAFVASQPFPQGGTYTIFYNEDTGIQHLRSGVYPHANLDHCEDAIVWDQPGIAVSDAYHVSVWDPYVDKRTDLGSDNTNPACGGGHLAYEKETVPEGEDEPAPRVYHLDIRDVRRQADARIEIDPGLEKGIFSDPVTFTGTAYPGDPREPIQYIAARVDQGDAQRVDTHATEDGMRWEITVDPDRYASGVRTLEVLAEDSMGSRTMQTFTFYTDTPYELDQNQLDTGLDVPRTEPSPFPFSVLDHYKAYQPFYNTILLLIVLIAAAAYGVYRYRIDQPPEPPQYVPPDDS